MNPTDFEETEKALNKLELEDYFTEEEIAIEASRIYRRKRRFYIAIGLLSILVGIIVPLQVYWLMTEHPEPVMEAINYFPWFLGTLTAFKIIFASNSIIMVGWGIFHIHHSRNLDKTKIVYEAVRRLTIRGGL